MDAGMWLRGSFLVALMLGAESALGWVSWSAGFIRGGVSLYDTCRWPRAQ